MRKIIFILSLLISVIGYSQTTTTTQYLGSPSTKVINRGVLRTDSSFQNAIRDTNFIPDRIGIQVMRPQDSSVYVSISTVADSKWAKIGGGSYVNLADSNTVYTTPTWVTNAIAAISETDPNAILKTGITTLGGNVTVRGLNNTRSFTLDSLSAFNVRANATGTPVSITTNNGTATSSFYTTNFGGSSVGAGMYAGGNSASYYGLPIFSVSAPDSTAQVRAGTFEILTDSTDPNRGIFIELPYASDLTNKGTIYHDSVTKKLYRGPNGAGGGSSGTVNAGAANKFAWYPSAASAVDDLSWITINDTNHDLTLDNTAGNNNAIYFAEGGTPKGSIGWDGTAGAYTLGAASGINLTFETSSANIVLDPSGGVVKVVGAATDNTATNVYAEDASGNVVKRTVASLGGVSPAGSNREIQFNNAGAFGASSGFQLNASNQLYVNGAISNINSFPVDTLGSSIFFRFGNYGTGSYNKDVLTFANYRLISTATLNNGQGMIALVGGTNVGTGAPAPYFATGTYSNHPWWVKTNNQYRLLVDSLGNVGIGTQFSTSSYYPAYAKLAVENTNTGQAADKRIISATNAGSTFDASATAPNSYTGYFDNTSTRAVGLNNVTNYGIYVRASGAQVNYSLVVPSGGGNMGVGTITPAAQLHTVGTVRHASLGTASADTTTYKPVGMDSNGDLIGMDSWPTGSSSGANTALSNLAAVAINTDLLPGTSDAIDLGSTTKQFRNIFLGEGRKIDWDNGDATLTQVGDVLTLAGADLKISSPGNASTSVLTTDGTQTLTNKRWVPRVGSTTSSATPTINTDNVDVYKLTAQAADITSFTTNLSGTPNDGDVLEIQITGTAARAITWGASFVSSTVTLPTTTTTTATLTVLFQYYTTSSYGNNKWVCANYY